MTKNNKFKAKQVKKIDEDGIQLINYLRGADLNYRTNFQKMFPVKEIESFHVLPGRNKKITKDKPRTDVFKSNL